MALAKYYEDIVEARRENGASVVYDYQHSQENAKRVSATSEPTGWHTFTRIVVSTDPRSTLRLVERIKVSILGMNLLSDAPVAPELLSQTDNWSKAHFTELARQSPEASARLAMAHRDRHRVRSKAILELLGTGN
jgi:hypothetical protein